MLDRRLLKMLDIGLIIVVIILFLFSLIMINSATHITEQGVTRQVKVQIIAFLIGVIFVLLILTIDYNHFANFYKAIYVFCILLLLSVYIPGLGKVQYGARSWINLGPIDFQPSEIVKIGFILSFAKFLENKQNKLNTFRDLLPIALYSAIPILLILKEPDLGNALVLMIIIFGMTFVCGINSKLVWKVVGIVFAMLPIAYKFMEPHQRDRIDAYLHPSDLSLPGNYQVWNSKVAIGSGKFLGKGLLEGTQKRLKFLPVQESDFIFAVLVEELGFIGGLTILILYFAFLYQMIKISKIAKDTYGSLIVVGIISMFAFQIFENIGMTMGVMPVTGVTLPFLSYGGSSLVTNMIAVGIVLNVGIRRQKIKF